MIIHRSDYINEGSELFEEGVVLLGNEYKDYFDEATGYEQLPMTTKDCPAEFKKSVLKAIDAGTKMAENKRGVGEGSGDAFWGTFGKHFDKTRDRIENEDSKKAYVLIVPQKIRIKANLNGYNAPEAYKKVAEEMIKSAGYKAGGKVKSGIAKGAQYYYKLSSDKKFMYIAFYTAPAGYYLINTQVQIVFRCCDYNKEMFDSIKESASTPYPDEKPAFTRYFNVEDVEPSLTDDPEQEFYRDPVFNKAITEYFDMSDKKTLRTLLHLNEANQNSVVMSLTSKLYDKIVEKCDDIDYGEIPNTKGDITKLSKYDSMKETISIMHDLLKEYKQDTGPVDELSVAFSNVETRKDLFERAYRYNAELPIAMYCNVVLGIITGISYMIATCIEFIKDPGTENFRISLDKVSYAKTKDHMIYNTLKSFNKSCERNEFDKAMEAVLKSSTKNFGGAAIAGGIAIGVLGTILVLIPVLRELIFMFYYMRMKVSDFFDIQADLLQANAYSIESNKTLDRDEQEKIIAKQLKCVNSFRKISNTFAIDMKKAEISAEKEKKSDDETKMLIDDIDGIDTGSNGSALF